MKKLSKTKEHPLTAFRKANEARDAGFKKSLPKAGLGEIVKTVAKYAKPAYNAAKSAMGYAKPVVKKVTDTVKKAKTTSYANKTAGLKRSEDWEAFHQNEYAKKVGKRVIGTIAGGAVIGSGLSDTSNNTKVNTNSAGTKTVVHTGANGKKYVKVTDKDGKTFNKVMNKKTGGMVTKYQSTGEVNESSKPVRTSAKPTVARPTGIKVNGVMQPIKYVKPTVAIRVRTSKPTVAEPVRPSKPVRPPVVTDNPMAGFEKINKPRPVGKYENAVEKPWDNAADRIAIAKRDAVKKPSPPTSNKINADKIKPSPAELAKIKAIKIKAIKSKAVASTKPVNKPKLKPALSTVDKIKLGLLSPTRTIMEMYKKKGGAVKTKK